jgi:hypothetical protein
MHDVIGNSVAFFFGQFLAKSAHKFRPKRKPGIADLIGGKPDGNEHPFRPIGLGPRSKWNSGRGLYFFTQDFTSPA